MMLVVLLTVALGAAAVALGWYSWPTAWLAAETALTPADPFLAFLAAALGVAALILPAASFGAVAIADRKWRGAREMVAADIARDAERLFKVVSELIANGQRREAAIIELYRLFNDHSLNDRLRYLAPSFSPEMTIYLAEYMERREYIAEALFTIEQDDHQLLDFTDRRVFRMTEWRFGDLPTPQQGFDGLPEYEACWHAFRGIKDLVELVGDHPMGGWKTTGRTLSVVKRARALSRSF